MAHECHSVNKVAYKNRVLNGDNVKDKKEVMKALAACSEFCCGKCPYQHLDDHEYPLRCIHTLIEDVYELLKEIT